MPPAAPRGDALLSELRPGRPGALRNRRGSNPHPPERQSGARPLRFGSMETFRDHPAMARRTNDAPTRESRSRVRTPSARRPCRAGPASNLQPSCIHRLSKSRDPRSQNDNRPTCYGQRRWGDRTSPSGIGRGRLAYGPGSAPPACAIVLCPSSRPSVKPDSSRTPPLPATTAAGLATAGLPP